MVCHEMDNGNGAPARIHTKPRSGRETYLEWLFGVAYETLIVSGIFEGLVPETLILLVMFTSK